MKRVIYQLALILSCLSFLPTLLTAQLPTGVNRPTGIGTGGPPTVPHGGLYTFNVIVSVANLDELHNVACTPGMALLPLPDNYPEMFLQFTANNYTETVPVDLFVVEACNAVGPSSFMSIHNFTVNLSEECENAGSGLFTLNVDYALLTEDGDIYPICDYTAEGDIFACDSGLFPMIECNNGEDANCDSDLLAQGGRSYSLSCEQEDLRLRQDNEEQSILNYSKESTTDIIISPNPFRNQITISVSNSINDGTLELFDMHGRLLKTQTNLSIKSNETLSLDLIDLPKGIYILQISQEDQRIHKKIIKS